MFLLEQGADPNATIEGVPALHAAAGPIGPWIDDWSRRHGVSTGPLASALGGSGGGDADASRLVKALLAKGADPNGRITTSAMFMGYIGYPKKGAFEPYATGTGDLRGATPLWVAAYGANGGAVRLRRHGRAGTTVGQAAKCIKALLGGGRQSAPDDRRRHDAADGGGGHGPRDVPAGLQRGRRSPTAEEAVNILLDAGADINAVNEADFTAIHGAAFRGLNEVIEILVKRGADINARDYRGRTPYRIAEGSKQSFQFQAYPETAEFIKSLGANTRLGVPGAVQERARDLVTEAAALRATPAGQP